MLKLAIAFVFIQVGLTSTFTLTDVVSSRTKRESVVDKGDHFLICKQEPLELGIVLDSSSSIRQRDFKTAIKFLQDFLRQYEISSEPNGVRVSIITYGRGIYPEIGFNLTTYNTSDEVINTIGKIPHKAGLHTDTGEAINFMHKYQLAKGIVRPGVSRVSIVITDGNSQEMEVTKKAADDARKDGIIIFVVGVGEGVKKEELVNIAGEVSHVTEVHSYEKLYSIKETLAYRTCFVETKPTTMPPPADEPCGVKDPADIFFVFSPGNLGTQNSAWAASMISLALDSEDMEQGFRYGVLSGSCPDDTGFNLDKYDNIDNIKNRLKYYDRNRVPLLVQTLIDDGFTEARGARNDSRKVVVIIVEGRTVGELHDEVAALNATGIQVIIADPSNRGEKVPGAEVLRGRDSKEQAMALVSVLCHKQN